MATPSSWTTVIVLVRGATDRIVIPHFDGGSPRVVVLKADLDLPDLGLSSTDVRMIRGMRVQAVVHSAAVVDHSRPYESLQAINVDAGSALIELVATPDAPPPRFVMVCERYQ